MGHYFDEQPGAPSDPRDVELRLPDMTVKLATDHGVFGYAQIDAGSKLLLLKAPAPPQHGNLLDLGCGAGAIAIPMARRAPNATVWAVDVNARAMVTVPPSSGWRNTSRLPRWNSGSSSRKRMP